MGAQRPWAGVQSVGWEQVYRLGPPDDPERKIPPAIGISHLPLGSKPLGCPAAVAFHEWVSLGCEKQTQPLGGEVPCAQEGSEQPWDGEVQNKEAV